MLCKQNINTNEFFFPKKHPHSLQYWFYKMNWISKQTQIYSVLSTQFFHQTEIGLVLKKKCKIVLKSKIFIVFYAKKAGFVIISITL